jgi:lipoprotein NlpI
MRERYEAPTQYSWIVYAVATMIFAGLAGYMIGAQNASARPSVTAAAAPAAPTPTPPTVVDESELRAFREILTRDPKNLTAAVKAANLLYDAHRWVEAIPFYQQAFALNPKDINVSTDLGTALFNAGRSEEALAQYDKSLAIDKTHAQTLFNIGVVREAQRKPSVTP